MKRLLAVGFVIAGTACAHFQHAPATPSLRDQWMTTLSAAQVAADSGKYESAERVLADFAAAHPRTHESRELPFWRALYRLDPNNKNGSLAAGVAGLDAYLGDDSTRWYRPEAVVLRRTAAVAQALKVAASAQATTTTTGPTTPDAMKSRDEEIASLRDQLAKVNAELDRIKKRLANPRG